MTKPVSISALAALIGLLLSILVNVAVVSYWGGELKQGQEDTNRRVQRIEQWIDHKVLEVSR